MEQIITNLHSKIQDLCHPDPKFYPDPSQHKLTWERNLMTFYGLTLALITFLISSIYFQFSSTLLFAILCSNIFGFVIFYLFCQSRVWIFHLLYALSSFMADFIALEFVLETAYFHIGRLYLTVTLAFTMTGSLWITLCSIMLQIFLLMTKYKDKLATCILEEGPDAFVNKFVNNILLSIAMLLGVNVLLVRLLEKRTIERAKAHNALENALNHQKTFIFSFSHELRNPINSLLGNLQLVLQGETLSPKAKEMLNTAKVCGEILLHNINNVLDTGKHDIGKLEINPMPTHIHELLQRTWGIYSELFRQKKLKSELKIEKDLPLIIKVDSHKINQILLNLLSNSIKFTERGSIRVTVKWLKTCEVCDKSFEPIPYDDTDEGLFEKEENISTVNISRFSESIPGFLGRNHHGKPYDEGHLLHSRPQQETKGILKIIVKDTGSGMKLEALEKLFKKFSQVSENVSQRQIGTGLGLFITKEICTAMNGEIRAYSRFGKGTAFVVCIPAISMPVNNIQRTDSESIIQQLTTKHLNAIIADDSPFNVNLISDYFAQFGASVASIAYNGSDAFMKYRECRIHNIKIDIVTLDIDMPGMDGRKACDKIREYEKENKLKPILIILISGNYDKEQIEEYLDPAKHKADCFLRKPVSFSEFHRAVYSLVNRK